MGFGSYDESEQEQPDMKKEDDGETVTGEIKGENSEHDGKDKTTDETTEEMLKHL